MPVVGFDLTFRRVLADGKAWGDVGPYEELHGTLRFAIDPRHAANRRITDVTLAPRNHQGRVEFAADVSVMLPVERKRTADGCSSMWSTVATGWRCPILTARRVCSSDLMRPSTPRWILAMAF